MKISKNRALFMGLCGMLIFHCAYWIWLIKYILSSHSDIFPILVFPIILSLIYCIYEKCIFFLLNSTAHERKNITTLWILVCFIGTFFSENYIYQEKANMPFVGLLTIYSSISCVILIGTFFIFRKILNIFSNS